jgi:transcription termination factor Rho
MPEGNEQPALLGDESEKKPKRTRSAPGSSAKRTPARKAGGKKPTKSIDLQVGEPSQGQLLETANRPSDQKNSERTAVDGSARLEVRHSLAEDQGIRPEERPVANHRTNLASEVNETQELPSAENGKHRAHGEITAEQPKPEPVYGEGLIEVSGKGFGFLRDPKRNYVQSPQDIFVTPEVVRKHALRDGLWIKGEIRRGSRGPQLFKLTEINGEDPERYRNLPVFEELTSINPTERIRLETVPDRYTTRVMDLMTPIGKGQRGLIVAPPRTGKTTLLQHIADAVVRNHPETSLIILLVDERPEEVTEIRRTVPKADIMASSNDSDIKSHTRIAQLAIERAKRLVEANRDVFVLMDSLTRVGRAFNNASAGSGRTMSGGMDSRAMEIPRKLFAAARNTEEAGSLTIMATALIETGSKMDELIFQEFKGTGNMEMVLDRQISDQRTYPSVDIFKSGTRREELLLPQKDLEKINTIRRGLAGHRPTEAIERLLSFLRKFPTNAQMLREIPG